MHFGTGPLPPILNRDLRAELRSLDTVGGFYRIEIDWLRWNWFDGSNISGIKPTESNRYAAALQQGWRVPFGPLGALTAPLIKSEFGILSSSELSRASCPGYGYARSYGHRALQTRGRGIVAAKDP